MLECSAITEEFGSQNWCQADHKGVPLPYRSTATFWSPQVLAYAHSETYTHTGSEKIKTRRDIAE